MNSVFLLVAALPVFLLGYRFYSKFIVLGTFRLDPNHPTPARSMRDDRDFAPVPRYLLFGQHLAATAGGTTIIGVAIAVIWGWVPAFLWIVTGIVVGGATYGLASLWLGARHQARSPAMIAGELIGPRARLTFTILAVLVLLLLNAVLALLIGQILTAHPQAAIPFWLQVPIALGLGLALRRNVPYGPWLILLIALVQLFPIVWLGEFVPFAFTGTLEISLAGIPLITGDGTLLWLVLVLVYSLYAVRMPVWKLARPRACLTGAGLGLALLVLFAGIVVLHPDLTAPAFNQGADLPATLPWLFITLSGGAIAGFYGLIAATATARQLDRETDARPIGYGAALVDGLLAIGVLIASAAGFSSLDDWRQTYGGGEGIFQLGKTMEVFITRFAHFVGALGLPRELALTMGAFVTASLALSTLETGLRVQKYLLAEIGESFAIKRLRDHKTLVWLVVGLTAAVALYDGHGRGGLVVWPLFGAANQILAGLILLLVTLFLIRQNRPILAVFGPMLFLVLVASWALIHQIVDWWMTQRWFFAGSGLAILLLQLWVLGEGFIAYRRMPREPKPPEESSLI